MNARRPAAALLLLCAFAARAACGTTLYVNRVVVAPAGPLRLAELVTGPGELPGAAGAALESVVATVGTSLLSVPSRSWAGVLEQGLGPDLILVGSRTLVVPRGRFSPAEAELLSRLADFLECRGLLGDSRAEIELVRPLPRDLQPDAAVRFTAEKTLGTARGQELSCTLLPAASERSLGALVLRVRQAAAPAGEGVSAGDKVEVSFRKGPLTIEMQGKALASAGFGDSVAVYVPDSLRSFSGLVIGKKAVSVELP
jgi:hypothetical protein